MARPRAISEAHEFRRDKSGDVGAKTFAVGQRRFRAFVLKLAAEVFAHRDVDHLLGDDAGAGEFELRDLVAIKPAQRLVKGIERLRRVIAGDIAVVDRFYRASLIFLDAAAFENPGGAVAGQAGIDVDGHGRIGVGTGSVIHRKIGLTGAFAQMISRRGTRTSGCFI